MANKPVRFKVDGMVVIMPPGAMGASANDSLVDGVMRQIALALDPEDKEWSSKYGFTYENDVFMMHRYCWCEEESCPWCGETNAPNFLHKKSGFAVNWYKYIGRSMEFRPTSGKELAEILNECLNSVEG